MNILSQYRDIKNEVAHIREILDRLESKVYGPRLSVISDMPKSPQGDFDQMTTNYIKLKTLREKYDALVGNLLDTQLQIEEMIETFEPIERDLIRYRYIDGLKWKKVFKKIGYGQRQTFRMHDNILEKIEKMARNGTS